MSSPNQKMPSCCCCCSRSLSRCWRRCRRWITPSSSSSSLKESDRAGEQSRAQNKGVRCRLSVCVCVRKFKCGESGRASVVGRKHPLTHTHTHIRRANLVGLVNSDCNCGRGSDSIAELTSNSCCKSLLPPCYLHHTQTQTHTHSYNPLNLAAPGRNCRHSDDDDAGSDDDGCENREFFSFISCRFCIFYIFIFCMFCRRLRCCFCCCYYCCFVSHFILWISKNSRIQRQRQRHMTDTAERC